MPFSAVIFDLDGTLLDTLQDIADSVNDTLAEYRLPQHTVSTIRYFVGDGARNLMARALPEDRRDKENIDKALRDYRSRYAQLWNVKTRPYEGIGYMLTALQNRKIKLAVLSNKPDEDTRKCVAEFFPNWRFDVVLGAREGVPLKPDPTAAIELARMLQLPPHSILFLGDTRMDIETASAAGMFPVGALWGFREREELERAGAKALIAHPIDLLKIMDDQ